VAVRPPTPPIARETSPASFPSIARTGGFRSGFALKSGDESAEITRMLFGITSLYFPNRRRRQEWVAPGAAAARHGGGAAGAPWEAGVVESDGKPLPTAPPPGPVPVNGTPKPAAAAPAAAAGTGAAAGSASAGRADDLVPADREYLRPILIRYAQANGLPA